jgi:hypothetical protein
MGIRKEGVQSGEQKAAGVGVVKCQIVLADRTNMDKGSI